MSEYNDKKGKNTDPGCDYSDELEAVEMGLAERVSKLFLKSKITPLLVLASIFIGIISVIYTPKEEEPQIVVPMVDIFVPYPGAGVKDVKKTVTEPLSEIMKEIPGVKYVYSTAMGDMGLVTVRFEVGEDEEKSITKLKTKIDYNMDRMPSDVMTPVIKKRSINDVPQVTLTFWSDKADGYTLRQIAEEAEKSLKEVEDVSLTNIKGGYEKVVRIEPDVSKLQAYNVDFFNIYRSLKVSNSSSNTGNVNIDGKIYYLSTGSFFDDPEDIRNLVISTHKNKPVYLKEVADIKYGAEVPDNYHFTGFNNETTKNIYSSVTISISKRKGSDSVVVSDKVLEKLDFLKKSVIPDNVKVSVTRNYGETAYEKVKTLIEHLLGAIAAVILVMTLTMGWRAGLVVFVALPVTFALTFFVYYMFDYTLNRVTLFALIFVTGLVVDDAIIVVENIERHFRISSKNLFNRAVKAVGEVGNPTILATIAVIVAIYPMAFVGGLMGPYMKPMPIGASLAMIFSLLVALIITPWLALQLLSGKAGKGSSSGLSEDEWVRTTKLYKFYKWILLPIMNKWYYKLLLTFVMVGLFLGAFLMVPAKMVVMKMLPFDNKNELQVIIDMPEGTKMEKTNTVATEVGNYLSTVDQVKNYQIYTGISAPINFNGLVRQYYLRQGENIADIQVNFVSKTKRGMKSHKLAKVIRTPIQEIGKKFNANIKIAEVPPGPPVLSTLVAEVYGPDQESRIEAAAKIKEVFKETDGVVDVDWFVEDNMQELKLRVDKEKAALTGISTEKIVKTAYAAMNGQKTGILHTGKDRSEVDIVLKLPENERTSLQMLKNISIGSMNNKQVPLSELVDIEYKTKQKPEYQKNLKSVVYVIGDVAGVEESPVYAILDMKDDIADLEYNGSQIRQYWINQPSDNTEVSMKWDGEWQITYEVFRDLGLAFAAVLVIMYFLLVAWFRSFATPIIMMMPIPLSLLGIIPGHYLFGEFFTATSMIGFIALAGIMVRNAILLIDFIEGGLAKGKNIKDAVIESGAIRTRPVFLTAFTVVVGALFMLPDPIFAGLGVSLIMGAMVSTILTLVLIPMAYYMFYKFMMKIGKIKKEA